jgi:hypothetical protein
LAALRPEAAIWMLPPKADVPGIFVGSNNPQHSGVMTLEFNFAESPEQ